MKKFMDENFLLSTPTAVKLFHDYAKDMPIIDYHCHLSPKEIYENKKFKNITEAWLYGDHYKWRAMRINGIDEKYITGDANDYDKFLAWAKTLSIAIGNPLYSWTHLELQRYFGIYDTLDENSAPEIWEKVNSLLATDDFSVRELIKKSNVKTLCTTDDPIDSLEYHKKLKEDNDFSVNVLPAFRPDKALRINKDTFIPWIKKLEGIYGRQLESYDEFLKAIESRVEFFNNMGCRVSDHAIDVMEYAETTKEEVSSIYGKALKGQALTKEEISKYKTYTLKFLGKLYHKFDWAMQLHIAALRDNNTNMYKKLGPDTGFDGINDDSIAEPLSKLLDSLQIDNLLPKTILYTLNPKDNLILATTVGNFQDGSIPGKIQFGSAWWFNDTKDGMIDQMNNLASVGLIDRFIGMLTDSRSFLSYTRHEYFRRIVCDLIGKWVENGEFPNDIELLGKIVQNISYNNAKEYFKI
ncbi:glucuronate isomerase [Clostridium tyrobutyricum]|uniref:glucuronate isomerase n=1 Tax=Clostridium tyrobutyricum TaxID=1519 RepID=UPI001C3CEAA1|nr:glucuronate isomerase [Clostridium tyrobutyricum]MBV4438324.1 glucuronate isomerase [Clostridium tyrobutyricum]